MSRQINQPSNLVKLTNVAVVRCNKAGKRFEIACYRNKVLDYRAGLEKDLSEVLQTDRIFTNVSKGKFANKADLENAFGTRDEEAIAKIILNGGSDHHHHHHDGSAGGSSNSNNNKGSSSSGGGGSTSMQVSDLERQQQLQNTTAQIATWVASNCVHPDTGRPYTVTQIKHALGKNYTVHPHKAIKKQYLDSVKFLKNVIPIERAKMELALEFPAQCEKVDVEPVLQRLPHVRVVATPTNRSSNNDDDVNSICTTICVQVDPSHYRELDELMKRVGGRLEILQQVVAQKEGDVDLEVEVLKRNKQQQQQQQQESFAQQQQQYSKNSNEPRVDPTKQSRGSAARNHLDDDDEEGARLVEKLEKVRLQVAGGGGHVVGDVGDNEKGNDDNHSGSDSDHQPMNKKSLRKAQKKNKKAKQKEQAARLEQEERQHEEGSAGNDTSSAAAAAAAAAAAKEDVVKSNISAVQQQQENQNQPTSDVATDAKSCNTCGGTFANAAQYRAHFRSDWHRFNQKLKLKGIAAVSEQEFLLCDAEEFFGTTN